MLPFSLALLRDTLGLYADTQVYGHFSDLSAKNGHFLQKNVHITFEHCQAFVLISTLYNQVKFLTGLQALSGARRACVNIYTQPN